MPGTKRLMQRVQQASGIKPDQPAGEPAKRQRCTGSPAVCTASVQAWPGPSHGLQKQASGMVQVQPAGGPVKKHRCAGSPVSDQALPGPSPGIQKQASGMVQVHPAAKKQRCAGSPTECTVGIQAQPAPSLGFQKQASGVDQFQPAGGSVKTLRCTGSPTACIASVQARPGPGQGFEKQASGMGQVQPAGEKQRCTGSPAACTVSVQARPGPSPGVQKQLKGSSSGSSLARLQPSVRYQPDTQQTAHQWHGSESQARPQGSCGRPQALPPQQPVEPTLDRQDSSPDDHHLPHHLQCTGAAPAQCSGSPRNQLADIASRAADWVQPAGSTGRPTASPAVHEQPIRLVAYSTAAAEPLEPTHSAISNTMRQPQPLGPDRSLAATADSSQIRSLAVSAALNEPTEARIATGVAAAAPRKRDADAASWVPDTETQSGKHLCGLSLHCKGLSQHSHATHGPASDGGMDAATLTTEDAGCACMG